AVQSISVAREQNGRMDIFALGVDNAIYYTSQYSAGIDMWTAWKSLGGVNLSFTVGTHAGTGQLEVFALGTNHRVFKKWENQANGSFISDWDEGIYDLTVRSVITGNNANGSLQLFALGQDGSVWTRWQQHDNTNWDPWKSLGGWGIKQLVVANNDDG